MRAAAALILLSFILACGNSKNEGQVNNWEGTRWEQLSEENIKLRLPTQFKKSSRYRLKEDVPYLANDKTKLRLVQNSLEQLEYEDAAVDVFVDTTKSYRLLIICNTQKINFSKRDVGILEKQLEAVNESNTNNYPLLNFGAISASLKRNQDHKLARFSNQVSHATDGSSVYNSIYYLTGGHYTLIAYEFCIDESSIEKYLWTTKSSY